MTRARLALAGVLALLTAAAPGVARGQAVDAGPEGEGAPGLSLQPAPQVVAVDIHGPRRFTMIQMVLTRQQIGIQSGSLLSRDAVRDAVERLYASGEYADVVVLAESRPGGVALTFELTPQKQLTTFTFQGATAVTRDELTEAALKALETGGTRRAVSLPTPYFPEQLEKLHAALERAYFDKGYQSANVSARAEDQNESEVTVIFSIDEGAPTRIAGISAAGEPGLLPEELPGALGLSLGQVLDRSAVTAGIERLKLTYKKSQRYRAELGLWRQSLLPGGELALLELPVEAGPQIHFHFHGNAHFDERALEARLGFSPDETFDASEAERMAARVRKFYVLNGFADAQVLPEEIWNPDRSKLVVVFDVDEGEPLLVKKLQFEGNTHFDNDYLVARVHESLGDAVPAADDEGPPSIEEGEAALPASNASTQASTYHPDPDTVFAEAPYKEALSRIVDLYKADGYQAVAVQLPRLEIDVAKRTAVVTVAVSEGPRTLVTGLHVNGVGAAEAAELQKLSTLKVGKPYNPAAEEDTRLAIARRLRQQGYLFAKVTTDAEHFSADATGVEVGFNVVPQFLVHVRSVIIRGNEHTREGVIRAGVALKQGDLFDQDKLDQSERNLAALGTFTRVEVHPLDPDHEDAEKDLVVDVEERPRTEIVVSPGGSLVDGPRLALEIDRFNFAGLGLNASLVGKINYYNFSYPVLVSQQLEKGTFPDSFAGHVDLGLTDPRIFVFQPAQIAGHIDLVAENIARPSYKYSRNAAILGFDWQITRWLSASLLNTAQSYYVKQSQLLSEAFQNLSISDVQQFLLKSGSTYLYEVTPSLVVDGRDNAANPHSGFFFSASAELAHDLGGPNPVFYLKPQGTVTVYVPLGKRTTLAISSRIGRIVPLTDNPDASVPAPERFFLGGVSTLRGFPEDGVIAADQVPIIHAEVNDCRKLVSPAGCAQSAVILNTGSYYPSQGGEAFVLYKVELRFPISGNFEGALFVDSGNLWLDPTSLSLNPRDLLVTPGVGLRYGTPVGPLALDVGFNPIPDSLLNETVFSTSYVQFSIGLF